MKISRNYSFLFILSIILISCSSNDDHSTQDDDQTIQEPVISAFNYTYRGEPYDPDIGISETFYLGNVTNNRIQNSTREHFFDGLSQGLIEHQLFEYDNNSNLIFYNQDLQYNDDIKEFAYDSNGNVVGITWTLNESPQYYRFVYPSSNIIYFERLSLPFNDPDTVAGNRHILEFDDNENVIKAGRDIDLDDIMDYENNFIYDSNNNLTNVQMANGEIVTYSYSTIINTYRYLEEKTFGKRLVRLINSEIYGHSNIEGYLEGLTELSYNISSQEASEAEFELLDNNFFIKKTIVKESSVGTATETRTFEYIFE